MSTNNFVDLSDISYAAAPYPHISSPQALQHPYAKSLFNWFETSAPWNITIADFYEQSEFDVLKADLPAALKWLVSVDNIHVVEQHIKDSFTIDSLELVGVVAHKLVDGQRIGIHNDFINGEETHRLVIHITDGWTEDNGGILMLFGSPDVKDVCKIIYPLNNFAFGFEISPVSHHGVSKIYNFSRYTLIYTFRDPVIRNIALLINDFLHKPFAFKDSALAHLLLQKKLKELNKKWAGADTIYSTALCINGTTDPGVTVNSMQNNHIVVESGSAVALKQFYAEHGLVVLEQDGLMAAGALTKLDDALLLIKNMPVLYDEIVTFVKAIQVVKTEDAETDISYSHPKVPFSIFVSLCDDNSVISNLRAAESIIHETMHLKLTLIENQQPLVKPNTGNVFFSPWRDEKRPAQGVLHGLFVFRIILAFYEQVGINSTDLTIADYLSSRKRQISIEIDQLNNFDKCPDLTTDGAILAISLLPLN